MTGAADTLFDPDLAAAFDEAFERVGIDPAMLTARHLTSARRSLNLMLADWSARGVTDWGVDRASQALAPGDDHFALPAGGYDILSAALIRDGVATPMIAISRADYLYIPRRDERGRPDRYFVDRAPGAPTVYFWQAADNAADTIDYWYFRQYREVGGPLAHLDMPHFFFEAFVAGLAARLAEKYSPQRVAEKTQLSEATLNRALTENGSRAPARIGVRYG